MPVKPATQEAGVRKIMYEANMTQKHKTEKD